jgi:hypothetical protein
MYTSYVKIGECFMAIFKTLVFIPPLCLLSCLVANKDKVIFFLVFVFKVFSLHFEPTINNPLCCYFSTTFCKGHVMEQVKPVKDKNEKKQKEKSKDNVGEITDAAKLRAKLEKIDAKMDDLKAKKQEIVARLLQLDGTDANASAAAPPVTR